MPRTGPLSASSAFAITSWYQRGKSSPWGVRIGGATLRDRLGQPDARSLRAMELLIVGGGRMGEALLGGLLGRPGRELAVAEVSAARREELAAAYPDVESSRRPIAADGAVLVVKPGDVAEAARAVAEPGAQRHPLGRRRRSRRARSRTRSAAPLPVVRAMPNTPALVGAGAAAISPGSPRGRGRPRVGGGDPRRRRRRRARAREAAGRGHRPLRLRPGLRLPRRRGDGGGRRARGPAARRPPRRSPSRRCSARRSCSSRAATAPRRCGRRSPRPAGRPPPGLRELERHGVRAAFLDAVTAAAERSRELGA